MLHRDKIFGLINKGMTFNKLQGPVAKDLFVLPLFLETYWVVIALHGEDISDSLYLLFDRLHYRRSETSTYQTVIIFFYL